jgi:hypothetical protein
MLEAAEGVHTDHCQNLPHRPLTWRAWGEEERRIWHRLEVSRKDRWKAESALTWQLTNEGARLLEEFDVAWREVVALEKELIQARLKRIIPDRADVIALTVVAYSEAYDECVCTFELDVPQH